ncbi:MAG: tetratricopeptide repeat protein [Methanobacteriota archaeon]
MDELGRLNARLGEVLSGSGRFILIAGDEGTGKSTLASEFAKALPPGNWKTLSANCYEGAPPYGVFVQSFRNVGIVELPWEEKASFERIFIINKAGLVLAHAARVDTPMDEDIVGGMISAVQNFVGDSLGRAAIGDGGIEEGGLGKLEYRTSKILIEHGSDCFCVGVLSGTDSPQMRRDLGRCVSEMESAHGDTVRNWSGDMRAAAPIAALAKGLLEKMYILETRRDDVDIKKQMVRIGERNSLLFDRLASESPTLLFIDDAHSIDGNSLQLLEHLVRTNKKRKLLVIAALQPMEGVEHISALMTLADKHGEIIHLADLNEPSAAAFVRSTCGDGLREELVLEIVKRTGGNPALLREYADLIVSKGVGDVAELDYQISSGVGAQMSALLHSKIDSLHDLELEVIELMAAMPGDIDFDILSRAVSEKDLPGKSFESALERLEGRHLVIRDDGAYRFSMPKVREIIYGETGERWRAARHRRIGETIEGLGLQEARLHELAYHFRRSREHGKALNYNLLAGEKSALVYAPASAIEYFEFVESLISSAKSGNLLDAERLPAIRERTGDMLRLVSRFVEAVGKYESARSANQEPEGSARLHRKIGYTLEKAGNPKAAIESFETGIKLVEATDSPELSKLTVGKGVVHWRLGEFDTALTCANDCLSLLEKQGNAYEETGFAFNLIGNVLADRGENSRALENYSKALLAREKSGNKDVIAASLNNIGNAHADLGDYGAALDYYKRALAIREGIGDLMGALFANTNIGALLQDTADFDNAMAHFSRALELSERLGVESARLYTNIAKCKTNLGDAEGALDAYTHALEIASADGDRPGEASANCGLAELNLATGRLEDASVNIERAKRVAEELDLKKFIGMVDKLEGDVLLGTGDKDGCFVKYESSINRLEGAGFVIDGAIVRTQYAELLAKEGRRESAREHLMLALQAFRKSNIRKDAERCEKMLEGLGREG